MMKNLRSDLEGAINAVFGSDTPVTGRHWYKVVIRPGLNGSVDEASFLSVKGISKKYEVETHAEGGRNGGVRTLRKGPATHGEVTLEQGLISSEALWKWSNEVQFGKDYRRMVTIHVMAHAGTKVVRSIWLRDAWPIEWSAPDLDAKSSDLAVDSLRLAYADVAIGFPPPSAKAPSSQAKLKEVDGATEVTFAFNPASMKLTRTPSWENCGGKAPNEAYPSLNFSGTSVHDELSIDGLFFDTSEDWASGGSAAKPVPDQIEKLYKLTLPQKKDQVERPPLVQFSWSTTRFTGVIKNLAFDYTLFDRQGKPVRAKVTLELKGKLETSSNQGEKFKLEVADS